MTRNSIWVDLNSLVELIDVRGTRFEKGMYVRAHNSKDFRIIVPDSRFGPVDILQQFEEARIETKIPGNSLDTLSRTDYISFVRNSIKPIAPRNANGFLRRGTPEIGNVKNNEFLYRGQVQFYAISDTIIKTSLEMYGDRVVF